jgi:peptidoglycan/xylan/chitin deacetylase (PgdA/CDA1 family)
MTALAALCALAVLQAAPRPTMAVTFDDLPVVRFQNNVAAQESVTVALLRSIVRHRIPAIGFVNEVKLYAPDSTIDPARVALLRRWLDAGLALGNHTYSHPSLHNTPLADYEGEVLRGETVLRPLLAERRMVPRFFRHPYLQTGRDLATRDSLTGFLAAHGYRVAPVTIDNSDYVFAAAYDKFRGAGDGTAATRVREAYIAYMESAIVFYESQALTIVGRPIPQILLVHASRLNADAFDALASRIEARGYRFIPLERALEDSAYASPNSYIENWGISWLQRWAMTRGMPKSIYRGEPTVPEWVTGASQ